MHTLLRAMSASHLRAQRLDAASTLVSIAIAASGFVTTFVAAGNAAVVTTLGALWALAYTGGIASWTSTELRRAAAIQEMFDVRLYELDWNYVLAGEPVEASDVSRLSSSYRGRRDMISDYYEIPDFPRPYDILACQMMNLGWGARVRLRFAHTVSAAMAVWLVTATVAGAVVGVTVAQMLLWLYIPSLGGIMLGLDMARRQRGVVKERQRVLHRLRLRLSAATSTPPDAFADDGLRTLARQIQDAIFLTRLACPRVPNWFFLRFRPTDRLDFAADMRELRSLIMGDHDERS